MFSPLDEFFLGVASPALSYHSVLSLIPCD